VERLRKELEGMFEEVGGDKVCACEFRFSSLYLPNHWGLTSAFVRCCSRRGDGSRSYDRRSNPSKRILQSYERSMPKIRCSIHLGRDNVRDGS
jgi:hypothetical protein